MNGRLIAVFFAALACNVWWVSKPALPALCRVDIATHRTTLLENLLEQSQTIGNQVIYFFPKVFGQSVGRDDWGIGKQSGFCPFLGCWVGAAVLGNKATIGGLRG